MMRAFRFLTVLIALLCLASCGKGVSGGDPTAHAEAPLFSPAEGTYEGAQVVSLLCGTAGASIHFTTDGSTPTTASPVYAAGINVNSSKTLKAISVKNGMADSAVASATYTITTPTSSRVETPSFSPEGGTYNSNQEVTITSETPEAVIYYTTDGSAPSTSGIQYSGPITVAEDVTIKAIAVKSGMTDSEVASAAYNIDITLPMAEAPVFSPPPGFYDDSQFITIETATPEARILYTTNGTVPNASSFVYSGPIEVLFNTTIKAIAVKDGFADSSVRSATYIMRPKVDTPTFGPWGGDYIGTQFVTISTATGGATIYYTTDGTTPTTNSMQYSFAISVSSTTTVKAIAVKSGMANSNVGSATYTILPPPKVDSPVFTPAAGTYSSAQLVTLSTATAYTSIYYTTDGTTPTTNSAQYNSAIVVNSTTTIKALAVKTGMTDSDMAIAEYEINVQPGKPVKIFCGDTFSMSLHEDGTVWAWGQNGNGQLGDGTHSDRYPPVQVPGLTDVISLALGEWHSLALKSDGTVWAWGENGDGQLGDGTRTDRSVRVQVPGLNDVVALTAGTEHSLAVKSDGTVWAWGNNSEGQLGDGTQNDRLAPIKIQNFSGARVLAANDVLSLALKDDGTVWGWGEDHYSLLGVDGSNALSPVHVKGLTDVTALALGRDHCLVLKRDGSVWGWGASSSDGQISGTGSDYPEPVELNWTGVVEIAAGAYFSLALKDDGTVWAWGDNSYYQVVDSLFSPRSGQVNGLTGVKAIAAGFAHGLAIKDDGTVWSWGSNGGGAVGDENVLTAYSPAQLSVLGPLKAIAAVKSNLAIKEDGTAWTWGQQGDSSSSSIWEMSTPRQIPDLSNTDAVVDGYIVFKNDGTAWQWSSSNTWAAAKPLELTDVVAFSGNGHVLALKNDGTVWAWGDNTFSQLGVGTMSYNPVPAQIPDFTGVTAVSAGQGYSLAVKNDGTVWRWGINESYFGLPRTIPVQLTGFNGAVSVEAGSCYGFALRDDGSVWAWGQNDRGQLGDGTVDFRNEPVRVLGLTGVISLSTDGKHTLALRDDGTVWTWGDNRYGQLGDGTTENRTMPVQVPGLNDVVTINAGTQHSVALKSDGTLWVWGGNYWGELGFRRTRKVPPATQVVY